MNGAIKLERDKLSINLGFLYDAMNEYDRLEFLDFVAGHDRLILHVCQAVGGGYAVEPIFSDDLRDRCIKALSPLLEPAAAKVMADALAKADKYEKAENQLRGMAHVYSMLSESETGMLRINQWDDCLLQMQAMYPEFQPITTPAKGTP